MALPAPWCPDPGSPSLTSSPSGVRGGWALMGLGLVGLAAVGAPAAADPAPASELIGCERAAEKVVLTASAHLDPTCVWTGGVEIRASGVTLDCQGATLRDETAKKGRGIFIVAPNDVPLADITVTGCRVEGFLNNVRVERSDWKTLEQGEEYGAPFSNIRIEDSVLVESRGSGIFINAYVTDVTMSGLHLLRSEGVGIYLEHGSAYNTVEGCLFEENGFDYYTQEDIPVELGPVTVGVDLLGREGLAIDGSRFNVVRGNTFTGDAAGGIFLYKNCGEHLHTDPEGHWERWYGADENLIEGNTFVGELDGIWVGSRMAQNQFFMDCSDPSYWRAPVVRIYRDYAWGNVLRGNHFSGVARAIRVEDDDALVEGNTFESDDPDALAVVIGTKFRTDELGEPVSGTTLRGNDSRIQRNPRPYTWIHGHEGTTFEDNTSFDQPVSLERGTQPPMTFHLFVDSLNFSLN